MADPEGSPRHLEATTIADLAQLRDIAASLSARQDFSPLGHSIALVLPQNLLRSVEAAPEAEMIAEGLASLPCPIIGLEPEGAAPSTICDLVLASDAELPGILTNLRQAPIAATTLVQLVRLSERLSISDGLVAESLAYATLQSGPEFSCWHTSTAPTLDPAVRDEGPAVLVERSKDCLDIRLNRPSRRNTIDVEMRDALCEAFELAVLDPDVQCVRLSGAGRCFSIGGDLTEFGSRPDPATAHAIRSVRLPSFHAARCAPRLEAHLHGACIGAGIELPSFAARVVATADSFFQLPELRFGLIPGAGGTVSLRRRIGRHRTAWLALSCRRINARTALAWGLVDEVVG